jgi:hypothetical protein
MKARAISGIKNGGIATLLEHRGKRHQIHESAYVAPTATIRGNVTIGDNSWVLPGSVFYPIVAGKIVEFRGQLDMMSLMQQLGVIPSSQQADA